MSEGVDGNDEPRETDLNSAKLFSVFQLIILVLWPTTLWIWSRLTLLIYPLVSKQEAAYMT